MTGNLELPVVDLSSSDRASTAKSIRLACLEYGFFYLVNHGIGEEFLGRVFEESKKFFSLPPSEKMELERNEGHRGYSPPYAEKLDPSLLSKGFFQAPLIVGLKRGSLGAIGRLLHCDLEVSGSKLEAASPQKAEGRLALPIPCIDAVI